MKKITSAFLTAVILIMSVFCVNAFAQEQTRMEIWSQNANDYEFKMRVTEEAYGDKRSSVIYYKEGKLAATLDIPLSDNLNIKLKVVIKDSYVYLFFSDFPLFNLKFKANEDMFQYYEIAELAFVKSYEEQNGSVTYYIEEFSDENNTVSKCYFSGDYLVKIKTTGIDEYGDYLSNTIEFLSYDVNDSVFHTPFFSINITPFINILYITG